MNNPKRFLSLFLLGVVFSLTLFSFHAFGQTNPPDPASVTNPPVATPVVSEQSTATALVMGFIPVLVPLLIAGKKKIMELLSLPKFPSWILPILAVGLGELLNWIASLEGHGVGPLNAGLLGAAGIGVRELIDQVKSRITDGAKISGAAALIVGALFLGFVATGCDGRLANGGAYAPGTNQITVDSTSGNTATNFVPTQAPDYPFAQTEVAFDFAYSAVDTVFNIERDNRQLFWGISPSIKHTLDKLRPQAVAIRNDYIKARIVYQSNPIPANLSALDNALARIKALIPAVEAAIPANLKTK